MTGSGSESIHVFICYRREDAPGHAGRLADALVERFGRHSVFMDVDTIEPGVDFSEAINRAIGHCDVLIALIGPHWLDSANMRGRRLDDPQDFVRLEIKAALERNIRVIPTLVSGAAMPEPDQLPGDLAGLTKRNAIELTDKRFRSDLQLLLEPLDRIAQQKRVSVAPPARGVPAVPLFPPPGPVPIPYAPPRTTISRNRTTAVIAALALILLVGGTVAIAANRLQNKAGTNATNASSSASPGTSAKAVALSALPSGILGTWLGSAHILSQSADFALHVTLRSGSLGDIVGDYDYPTVGRTSACRGNLMLETASSGSSQLTPQPAGGLISGAPECQAKRVVIAPSGGFLDWKVYNAAGGTLVAQASLAQGPAQLGLSAAYVGAWQGSVDEFGVGPYLLTATIRVGKIGDTVGQYRYPSLDGGAACHGVLVLDSTTNASSQLASEPLGGLISGAALCQAKEVAVSPSGQTLDWKVLDAAGGRPLGDGALNKTS